MGFIETIKGEKENIQKAPLSFLFTLLILASLIFLCVRCYYKDVIDNQQATIESLEKRLDPDNPTVPSINPETPPSQSLELKSSQSQSGSAETKGMKSPAVTGSDNTIIYGDEK